VNFKGRDLETLNCHLLARRNLEVDYSFCKNAIPILWEISGKSESVISLPERTLKLTILFARTQKKTHCSEMVKPWTIE